MPKISIKSNLIITDVVIYLLNNKYFYFGCISLNIACKFKCYTSKSKLVLCECNANDLYFIIILAFTLHEIKQCPLFLENRYCETSFLFFTYSLTVNYELLYRDK